MMYWLFNHISLRRFNSRMTVRKFVMSTVLASTIAVVVFSVAAEEFSVVEVAAPDINCLANTECQITVKDSIGVLGEGSRYEFGFLQSRSVTAQPDAPASGYVMMQYRLHLLNAEKRRNTSCVTRLDLRSAPPEAMLDLDGDGQSERAVFAVTRGALGTIVPSFVHYESGHMTIEFAEGVCPPGSRKGVAATDGDSSVFFGWFARGEPKQSTSRALLADQTELFIEARALEPKIDRITYAVDKGLSELRLRAPGFLRGQTRETDVIRDADGTLRHFIAGEIVLTIGAPTEVDAFLERHGGQILRSFDPRDFGADEGPVTYHIGIDPDDIEMATEELAENLVALGYEEGGSFTISSEAGLRLLALVAKESKSGLEIDVDWVFEFRQFLGFTTQEAVNFGATIPGYTYFRNAYTWPSHSSGSNQDIGVGDAWTMLARVGRLTPTVKLGVIDRGFSFTLDNIDPLATTFGPDSPADTSCSSPCNHGAKVASVFAAIPDNGLGSAGPAGPVASEIVCIATALNSRRASLGHCRLLTKTVSA